MPETKVLQLTAKTSLTLTQITHYYLVAQLQAFDAEKKYEHLRPKDVPGYTREQAFEHIESYRAEFIAYASKINAATNFIFFGTAWLRASLDMDDDSQYESEKAGAIALGRKMGLGEPKSDDLLEMGALAYALVERLLGHTTRDDVMAWLREGAGLLDSSAVEAERKSPPGDGEQPADPGSQPGDAAKNKGRRKNARNRGG